MRCNHQFLGQTALFYVGSLSYYVFPLCCLSAIVQKGKENVKCQFLTCQTGISVRSFFERLFSTADSDTNPIMPGERGGVGGEIEEGRATGRKHKKMIPWGCVLV